MQTCLKACCGSQIWYDFKTCFFSLMSPIYEKKNRDKYKFSCTFSLKINPK